VNRALDLAAGLHSQLVTLGARSLSVREVAAWTLVKIGAVGDDALRAIALGLGLEQARLGGWARWRQVEQMASGLVVVTAGLARTRRG
jgi:hypothetical protein